MFDSVRQDIHVGARTLARARGFTLAAVLTLALGIGLSTAVFSIANALLLRRLPVRDQDRIVALWGESRDRQYDNVPLVGREESRDFARASRALSAIAFVEREGALSVDAAIGDQTGRLRRALVSGTFFGVLGANPILGRALRAEDDESGAAPVAVLSYAGWQRQFDGDPRVVGRHFKLTQTGFDMAVVGVMPQGLDYPRGTDFWTAVTPATTTAASDHPFIEVDVLGRLAPGVAANAARDELTTFFARPSAPRFDHDVHGVVHTLPTLVLGDVKPAVVIFTVAVGLLLLITCVNVANLLLIRGVGRVRELAVRSALGASRSRILRQLLTESAMIALAGGLCGAILAGVSLRAFVALAPADVPRLDEIRIGIATLGTAMLIAMLATLIFGVAPSVMATRRDGQAALRSGTRQTGSRRVRRATELLVVGQVALALMILSAAGLIARSLLALEHAELAYDSERLMIAELALPHASFGAKDQQIAFLDQLLPRVRALPGVEAVSPVNNPPFSGFGIDARPAFEGQTPADAAKNPIVNLEAVAPDYFATLGISIIGGRAFTDADRDGSVDVAIVNRSLANRFWPGESPIGKRLLSDVDGKDRRTIVGVVPDTRYRDLRDTRPSVYLPLRQSPFPFAPTMLAIRTRGRTDAIVAPLRATIADVAAAVSLASARSFDEILAQPLAHPRLNAALLVVFAGAAVLLAAVGLFGVMTTMVRQRTGELGVRMALGATSGEIGSLVLARGVTLAAIGIATGLTMSVAINNLLIDILYHVTPTDVVALAGATALLLALSVLAVLLPARASARIEPSVALRSE